MERYTIYWSHPYHGWGSFVFPAKSAEGAAVEAAQNLGEDFADDETDEIEVAIIIDDLDVVVYEGEHEARPAREPDFVLE